MSDQATLSPESLKQAASRAVQFRHQIHAHPELAFEEVRTSSLVKQRLEELGYEVDDSFARTGVVGILRGKGTAPAVGFRADMDALPIEEAETPGKEKPYRSKNPGKMHAC
ncbi:MAG: hypothetical protein KDK33_07200, partial [Leptospiraceae bacterium]|nr:hypothetical protein [Leptospiraceae bacterium]